MSPWRKHPPHVDLPVGYPSALESELELRDGRQVLVRPILPSDVDELRRAIDRADPETLRSRFLGGRPPQTPEELSRLVCLDYDRRFAVAAFASDGQGVGIARYEALGDTTNAEVAVAVDPDWRHVGLATALLRILAGAAAEHGVNHLTAEFFTDNLDVADLLAESGAHYSLTNEGTDLQAADLDLPDQL